MTVFWYSWFIYIYNICWWFVAFDDNCGFVCSKENVEIAGRAICEEAAKKISSDDVILTYGYSSLLLRILLKAYIDDGKKFRVVVLDGSPRREGLQFLRRLAAAHIPAVYMLISGVSYIMPKVGSHFFFFTMILLLGGRAQTRLDCKQL